MVQSDNTPNPSQTPTQNTLCWPKGYVLQSGQYCIVQCISKGPISQIYRAERSVAGSLSSVALKRLNPQHHSDPTRIAKFLREAYILRLLDSTNVIRSENVFSDSADCYFELEYADQGTLIDYMQSNKIDALQAVEIATEICQALCDIHDLGIVHGDVSLQNILLFDRPQHKLLAKLADFTGAYVPRALAHHYHIVHEDLHGKLLYAPDEQIHGNSAESWFDLYALGWALLYMISPPCHEVRLNELGASPGTEPCTTIRAYLDSEELPETLASVIEKLLSREQPNRYKTTRLALSALQEAQNTLSLEAINQYLLGSDEHLDGERWSLAERQVEHGLDVLRLYEGSNRIEPSRMAELRLEFSIRQGFAEAIQLVNSGMEIGGNAGLSKIKTAIERLAAVQMRKPDFRDVGNVIRAIEAEQLHLNAEYKQALTKLAQIKSTDLPVFGDKVKFSDRIRDDLAKAVLETDPTAAVEYLKAPVEEGRCPPERKNLYVRACYAAYRASQVNRERIKAIDHLEQVIKYDPNHEDAKRNLIKLCDYLLDHNEGDTLRWLALKREVNPQDRSLKRKVRQKKRAKYIRTMLSKLWIQLILIPLLVGSLIACVVLAAEQYISYRSKQSTPPTATITSPVVVGSPSLTQHPTFTPSAVDTPTLTVTSAAIPVETNTTAPTSTSTSSPAHTPTSSLVPTPTDIATATSTPTATNTATRAPSPTFTPAATETTTSATPPPPTPPPVVPALQYPYKGQPYKSPITFRWDGSLAPDDTYQVHLYHRDTHQITQSELLVTSNWIYDLDSKLVGEWQWKVYVIRKGRIVAESEQWVFYFDPIGGSSNPTPGPIVPTPTPPTPVPTPPTPRASTRMLFRAPVLHTALGPSPPM